MCSGLITNAFPILSVFSTIICSTKFPPSECPNRKLELSIPEYCAKNSIACSTCVSLFVMYSFASVNESNINSFGLDTSVPLKVIPVLPELSKSAIA